MIDWRRKVADAPSIRAVVEVTGAYLSSLTHEDWAQVPGACRPCGIQGVHGLRFWHDRLVNELCAAEMGHTAVHRDLVAFFVGALERAEALQEAPAANDAAEAQGRRGPTKP